jgi:hypothetical protein
MLYANLERQLRILVERSQTRVCECGHADYVHMDGYSRLCSVPWQSTWNVAATLCMCSNLRIPNLNLARPYDPVLARELRLGLGHAG